MMIGAIIVCFVVLASTMASGFLLSSGEGRHMRPRLGVKVFSNPWDYDYPTPGPNPIPLMRNPLKNKGSSFTNEERDKLNLEGFLPAGEPLSLETKIANSMEQLRKKATPLDKYLYLHAIQDSDETLFYAILAQHTAETMPLVYTPTVGAACQEWSKIYRQIPRGLYLSTKHIGRVEDILSRYPNKDVKVIVFTDGERILGLGDLGSNGMGIPIGKLALYTTCAGIRPDQCLPVLLDVGTNTESIRNDPAYVGLRQPRDRSEKYDELVDEFVKAAQSRYGRDVLLQFEDFGNTNAFRLLDRYKETATCFNDDIQGTASVVVAGLKAALPLTPRKRLGAHRYLFFGAGEAGIGIADLLVSAIAKEEGVDATRLSAEKHAQKLREIRQRCCWFVDSKGLVTGSRDMQKLEHHKVPYAHDVQAVLGDAAAKKAHRTLLEAVQLVQPTALVGVSAQGQTFTKEVVTQLMQYSENPVIFALSNPTHKAECSAEQAYTWTNGKAVFASGSPFDAVKLADGRSLTPGQGNNAYIFPGVGLGALLAKASSITDEDFLVAAEALASLVTEEQLKHGCVYPELSEIRHVSQVIAGKVAENIYRTGRALRKIPSKMAVDWHVMAGMAMYKPEYAPAKLPKN